LPNECSIHQRGKWVGCQCQCSWQCYRCNLQTKSISAERITERETMATCGKNVKKTSTISSYLLLGDKTHTTRTRPLHTLIGLTQICIRSTYVPYVSCLQKLSNWIDSLCYYSWKGSIVISLKTSSPFTFQP
jgi:hypothetical protein